MSKTYKMMTEEERSEAIVAEIKGVFTDLSDVAIGTTGLVVGSSLKIVGLLGKGARKVLHGAASLKPIASNATAIKSTMARFMTDPESVESVPTEEQIKAAEEAVKAMKKKAAASSK